MLIYFSCLSLGLHTSAQRMAEVIVKYLQETHKMEIKLESTLQELKESIFARISLPVARQRLTFKGNILSDMGRSLEGLGLAEGSVVYVNKVDVDKGTAKEIKGQVCTKAPEQQPELAMMKDPAVKKILDNPDIFKNMIESIPGIKKEMKANPELSKMIESPQMMEEMSKLAEDPEYMNTQMKNADIAMAKLETIPGGFNILRSTLKTYQDPLINALGGRGGSTISFEKGIANGKINKTPAPNPWGTQPKFNPMVEYRKQAEYMRECGFTDAATNLRLLIKHSGDADDAINEILSMESDEHVYGDKKKCPG